MKRPARTNPERIEELRVKLGRGASIYRDLEWPGGTAPIRIRLLTRTESQEAFGAAWVRMKEIGIDELAGLDAREELQTEHMVQTLYRAIEDRERHIAGTANRCHPFFATVDECRDTLIENDELSALLGCYLALKADSDPEEGELLKLGPQVLDQIAEAQKKRRPSMLKGIDISSLRSFIVSTGAPPSSSLGGKSGSSSSDTRPETTPDES